MANDLTYGDPRFSELHAAFTKLVREHRIDTFNFIFVIDKREYAVDFTEKPSTLNPLSPYSIEEQELVAR